MESQKDTQLRVILWIIWGVLAGIVASEMTVVPITWAIVGSALMLRVFPLSLKAWALLVAALFSGSLGLAGLYFLGKFAVFAAVDPAAEAWIDGVILLVAVGLVIAAFWATTEAWGKLWKYA